MCPDQTLFWANIPRLTDGVARRPIHWDSFTFYTTLGGLISFAAIYAGVLLYVAMDRRHYNSTRKIGIIKCRKDRGRNVR
jgi:hypothetical protein